MNDDFDYGAALDRLTALEDFAELRQFSYDDWMIVMNDESHDQKQYRGTSLKDVIEKWMVDHA